MRIKLRFLNLLRYAFALALPAWKGGVIRESVSLEHTKIRSLHMSTLVVCRMARLNSFQGAIKGYLYGLSDTPSLFWRRVFLTKTFDQMVQSAQLTSHNPMKRVSLLPQQARPMHLRRKEQTRMTKEVTSEAGALFSLDETFTFLSTLLSKICGEKGSPFDMRREVQQVPSYVH